MNILTSFLKEILLEIYIPNIKYQSFIFFYLSNKRSPVFPSLEDIYCRNKAGYTANKYSLMDGKG